MGSVFVVRGSVDEIACDAWLLPSASNRSIRVDWWRTSPRRLRPEQGRILDERHLGPGAGLCRRIEGWHAERDGVAFAQAWFTDVASTRFEPEPWRRPLRDFVRAAGAATPAGFGRRRPLLAVPLIGSRGGAHRRSLGEICLGVLTMLRELATEHDVDLVLVLKEARHYAAAQSVRRRAPAEEWWPNVSGDRRAAAAELAARARSGELVLFLGAGVSLRAGIPGWKGMIRDLALRAGMSPAQVDEIEASGMGHLEQAAVIDAFLATQPGTDPVAARNRFLSELSSGVHASLTHCLLAGLPVREAATTNYDTLFERASRAAGRQVAALPYEPTTGSDQWVLKLHGSADRRPADLVLSRDDYLRHAQRSTALTGLVHALLITRHLLFVGYSLNDDVFHRIAFDVRQALGHGRHAGRFGTALMVGLNPHLASVWGSDVGLLDMGAGAAGADALEEFLDLLGCLASTHNEHIADHAMGDLLSPAEKRLRSQLEKLDLSDIDPAVADPLRAVLRTYGFHGDEGDGPTEPPKRHAGRT